MLTDLIVKDGVCQGAMGIHLPRGLSGVFRAKATVMATGGTCWINGWNTVAPQSGSVPDNTSDLEMSAFRHGALIVDSNGPITTLSPSIPRASPADTPPAWAPIVCRWVTSRTATEICSLWTRTIPEVPEEPLSVPADRGSVHCRRSRVRCRRVYVDYSTEEARSHIRYFYRRNIDLFRDTFGIDPHERPYRVRSRMIEHQGSILTDEKAMSREFAGLFCARGGGMTGAAGSPGVSHNYLYGNYAAHCAAEYAKTAELGELDFALIEAERERLEAIRTNAAEGDLRPVAIRRAIQKAAGSAHGHHSHHRALEAARDELARIRREDLPRQAVGSPSLGLQHGVERGHRELQLAHHCRAFGARLADARGEPRQLPAPRNSPSRATIGHARWPSAAPRAATRRKRLRCLSSTGSLSTGRRRLRPEGRFS